MPKQRAVLRAAFLFVYATECRSPYKIRGKYSQHKKKAVRIRAVFLISVFSAELIECCKLNASIKGVIK